MLNMWLALQFFLTKSTAIIFLMEFTLVLTSNDGRIKVWRRAGERFADCCTDRVTSFNGGSVMVWGGISLRGKTNLVIIEGNLNALRYRDEILDPVAIPYLRNLGPNAILQDDNARPHRARIITEYLQNLGVERMEWPAMSPDLNPIEHLWDQLGRAVYARVTHGTTLADLKQMLVEEWDAMPQQNVAKLVSSMRRRCHAVASVFGNTTRY